MATDPVSWLEVAEKASVGLIAIVLLGACIKWAAVLLEHKKASEDERAALNKSSEDERAALNRANDEARIALVNKLTDALVEIATQRAKHDD